jgi:DNA-binding NtrC family response regulator
MARQIDILFVDDQWCRPEEQSTIIAAFGSLTRREVPYVFHYETAEDGSGGYTVEPVMRKMQRIAQLRAVILDIMFGSAGDRLGLKILEAIRQKYPILPVFMMTSIEGDLDVIEKAMELGANEYLIKKPTLEELQTALRTYIRPLAFESEYPAEAEYAIWGNSPAIRHVRALIARVAYGGTASVLITGESGTGKELVARAIHRQGPRRKGPFEVKNCAHVKELLEIDSDLFGYEKGAFTGADKQYIGRIERSNGGMLFLDEIGSMSPELQGKLLRVLETKEFQRLGGREVIKSDFQLICATNENPQKMLSEGRLREDLFYRINQFHVEVPSLKERGEDILILADLFLQRFKANTGASYHGETFSVGVLKILRSYTWPGNVRELKNVVERVAILSRSKVIDDISLKMVTPSMEGPSGRQVAFDEGLLPEDSSQWPKARLLSELRLLVAAKEQIQEYKGKQWKAEFMRLMYPECKAQSAKGFDDLIRRLTKGPWGDPSFRDDKEMSSLIGELEK